MSVYVAKQFFESLEPLGPNEVMQSCNFIRSFIEEPTRPGHHLKRVDRSADKNVWAARISLKIRAVLYQDNSHWHILYAEQHDAAYDEAVKKQIKRNDITGSVQIYDMPVVQEETPPTLAPAISNYPLFPHAVDDDFLRLGVPPEFLPSLRGAAEETELCDKIIPCLPEDARLRVLSMAAGVPVSELAPIVSDQPATASEDIKSLFVKDDSEELRQMLNAPMAQWIGYLHPTQARLAYRHFSGPLKITGSAGTGKTVTALHRARFLARAGKQVFVTSYVTTLCDNLRLSLELICSDDELKRIRTSSIHSLAATLLQSAGRSLTVSDNEKIRKLITRLNRGSCPLDDDFLMLEWESIIQAQGITSWDQYRSASRVGRGRPLSVAQRKQVWQVFQRLMDAMQAQSATDWTGMIRSAREFLESGRIRSPFDAVVVDEMQDLGPQEIQFLAVLAGNGPDGLTLAGDGGQRIYGRRFSLKSLGIDVRGRSHILRINYRTTEQIRRFADDIQAAVPSSDPLDTDENDDLGESPRLRPGARSLLHGENPALKRFHSAAEQVNFIVAEIRKLLSRGWDPGDIAVFARSNERLGGIEAALEGDSIPCKSLKRDTPLGGSFVTLANMHRAKGLEFKAVFVMDASDDIIPKPASVNKSVDALAQEEALVTERNLLYVSITRARHLCTITWVGQPSRFVCAENS